MGRALVVIRTDADRQLCIGWCQRAPVGTRVTFQGPRRSLPQNDLMWARLTDLSEQLDWHGEKLTPDDWKDVMMGGLRKARLVPGIEPGSFVPLGMRTSDLSKEEMSDLLDLIAAFGAQHNVVFSDERENVNVR